jgi:CRP-like cAMP-binding protein
MTKKRTRKLPSIQRPPPAARSQASNLLLAALPAADYARILPTLDIIPLKLKEMLHAPGVPMKYVYFPGGGFCSVLTVLESGAMVEVTTIGREGMVGVPALLNGSRGPGVAMVQAEMSTCYRMTTEACRGEMDRRGAFYDVLSEYTTALLGVIMQATACNAVHRMEQRLSRWLLMAHDRVGTDDFPLTQEFVAIMLGVTRPTVTLVARTLQKAGLITYHHGHITILDREGLESAACECYRVSADLLRPLTPLSPST